MISDGCRSGAVGDACVATSTQGTTTNTPFTDLTSSPDHIAIHWLMDGNVNRYSSTHGGLRVEEEVTFKRKGGWFISKTVVLVALLAVILLLIITALTTRYVVKSQYYNGTESEAEEIKQTGGPVRRLTGDVVPLYYRMMLQPYLNVAQAGFDPFRLIGYIRITIQAKSSVSSFQIHASGLDIQHNKTKLTVINREESNSTSLLPASSSNRTFVGITSQNVSSETELFTINLSEDLEKDTKYILDLHYSTPINDKFNGIYRSSYIAQTNREKRWLAVSNLQPTYARQVFPCFDEPSYKSNFEISILRRHNMSSLSNMEKRSEQPLGDGWVWDHFLTTPNVSPNLVGILVSDFGVVKGSSNTPKVSTWARSDVTSQLVYATDLSEKMIAFCSSYFGTPYSLAKLDVVAVPDLPADGVPSWGMIMLREPNILYKEDTTPMLKKLNIINSVAHEVLHQWIGNLMTPKWWDSLWLNEGLAKYMEYIGSNHVDSQWSMKDFFVTEVVQKALLSDSFTTGHPLLLNITKTEDINDYFDDITYLKGGSIMRMLESALGESNFKIALQNYTKKWSNETVDQHEFWTRLDELFKGNETLAKQLDELHIKDLMDSWTTNKGYPVLTVVFYHERGEINIQQEPFSFFNNTEDSHEWYIPISYITMDNKNNEEAKEQSWMKTKDMKITLKKQKENKWIIVNPDQTGFFRVNYDKRNWKALSKTLMTIGDEILSPITRAQLIDDSFQLARAGYLNYDIPLNLTMYVINKEKSYAPWRALLKNINYLEIFFWDSPDYTLFKEYVTRLIEPIYKSLGNERWPTELPPQGVLRKLIANEACKYELSLCVDWAKKAFDTWMTTKDPMITEITPDLREVAICTAIHNGGKDEVNFVWTMLNNPMVHPQNMEILIKGLTCSKTPWVTNWLLSEFIYQKNNSIPLPYIHIVWEGLMKNPATTHTVFSFVRNNWHNMVERFNEDSALIRAAITGSSFAMTSEAQLDNLLSFKEKTFGKQIIGLNRLDESIEYVEQNIKWKENNLKSVTDWMRFFKKVEYKSKS